jgi:predicted secreted protein
VPWYLDWRRKPHLTIINPNTRNSTFYLTKAKNNHWEATLELVIKNEKRFSQREWFWHILVPTELNPQFESIDQAITCQHNEVSVNGKTWRHYFGNSTPKEVIFPRRTLRFNYKIKIMTSQDAVQKYQIHYYFNTEFGTWPRKADQIESIALNPSIDQAIAFGSEYLGHIDLEPEKE